MGGVQQFHQEGHHDVEWDQIYEQSFHDEPVRGVAGDERQNQSQKREQGLILLMEQEQGGQRRNDDSVAECL